MQPTFAMELGETLRVRARPSPNTGSKRLDAAALTGVRLAMCRQIFRAALAAFFVGVFFGSGSVLAASAENGKAAFLKYGCWQ